jgi:two-component system KDP operon response regulator KdpE
LAEDNPANISTFKTDLTAHGYQLIVAHNGEEVVSLAKANQLDLILMDLTRPDAETEPLSFTTITRSFYRRC